MSEQEPTRQKIASALLGDKTVITVAAGTCLVSAAYEKLLIIQGINDIGEAALFLGNTTFTVGSAFVIGSRISRISGKKK